jgi:hypothetical protein
MAATIRLAMPIPAEPALYQKYLEGSSGSMDNEGATISLRNR